jgi:hypothetical protein
MIWALVIADCQRVYQCTIQDFMVGTLNVAP